MKMIFKKNIQILNDRRISCFSKNRTLLIYTIFRLVFALISLEVDALKFFIFVILQVFAFQNIV